MEKIFICFVSHALADINKLGLSLKAEKIPCTEAGYCVTDGNIAAIDFGTTSVSLAYTTKGDDKINNLILDKTESNDLTRVPNAILLKREEGNKIKVTDFGKDATKRFTSMRKSQYSDYIYFERIKILMKKKKLKVSIIIEVF